MRKPEEVKFTSLCIPAEILAERRWSGVEKHIICDVGYFMSTGREYKFKYAQIAVKLGVTRKAVFNAIARLKASGKITDTGRDNYHHNLHLNRELSTHFERAENKDIALPTQKTTSNHLESINLAELLLSEIQRRKPDFKKPNIQVWVKSIDLMISLDNRKPERIAKVIRWCQADNGNGRWNGWQDNILSAKKLREKFDKLELSMSRDNEARKTIQCSEPIGAMPLR